MEWPDGVIKPLEVELEGDWHILQYAVKTVLIAAFDAAGEAVSG